MHDIFHENSGSKNFGNEIKNQKTFKFKEIISKNQNFKYGTGIIYLK